MPYTILSSTSGCYEGTTVLINRFDIRSQKELDLVESTLVSAKAAQWEETPLCASFDFAHYKQIHRFLFADLYDWAGTIRSVELSKKGTQFCPVSEIERVGKAVFDHLSSQNRLRGLHRGLFVERLADFYERTNDLHPFREGNGRTQRVFLAQLVANAGYNLDFSCIEPDELMIATIQASQGSDDFLREVLSKTLKDKTS